MDFPLQLNRFAYHYIDQKETSPIYSECEMDVEQIPPAVQQFLMEMVAEIWNAPDAGSTRSGRFSKDHADTSLARPFLESIRQDPRGFFDTSKRLAELLHEHTHPNASPGILAVMRLTRPEDGEIFVALIKIRHKDEEFVRLNTGDLPRLEVEHVQNILLKEIQKGAIIPHPEKQEYDLKVIDAQARDDPAAYFTEKFLGCVSKKSDELQIRKLAPVLERYAEERQLPIAVERVAQVIQELQVQPEDITTPVLVGVVGEQALFGEEFQIEDFEAYIEESSLGRLDIPKEQFQRKRRSGRKIIYRFTDPEYEGLEISGPPEAFQKILSADGQKITFTVQTASDGFSFDYQ